MRKLIVASVGEELKNIAWLSFQPDYSISFGLNDRTYISPSLRERISIWNAYNRVKIAYVVPSDPSALEPIQNPHFTYHPDVLFHLKRNEDSARDDEAIFRGIADVPITLEQNSEMPWIRAVSAPIYSLSSTGARLDNVETSELKISIPDARASIRVEIDFVKPEAQGKIEHRSRWCIPWGKVALRITVSWTCPQIATLSWFHFS